MVNHNLVKRDLVAGILLFDCCRCQGRAPHFLRPTHKKPILPLRGPWIVFLCVGSVSAAQQPTEQRPIRKVEARLVRRLGLPGAIHRTRPTSFLCVGIEPTLRWPCPECVRMPCVEPPWPFLSHPSPPFLFPPRTSRTSRPRTRRRAP